MLIRQKKTVIDIDATAQNRYFLVCQVYFCLCHIYTNKNCKWPQGYNKVLINAHRVFRAPSFFSQLKSKTGLELYQSVADGSASSKFVYLLQSIKEIWSKASL